MANPVIRYCGELVEVTPDTARDLVGRGVAVLVEGEISVPPPAPDPVLTELLTPTLDTTDLTPGVKATLPIEPVETS